MEKLVLANLKANLAPSHVDSWLQAFSSRYTAATSLKVVLAVPYLYMERIAAKVRTLERVTLAAQGVSPYPPGGYTGATPAAWLKGLAGYALVGHRERRHYFHEDNQSVAGQVRECVAAELQPIVCMGRKGRSGQLAALDTADLEQCLLAYTPGDAVKLEVAAGSRDISDTAASLATASNGCPVLYGGGVNKDNAAELINLPGISGIMVGRSCLDGAEFAGLVKSVR